MELIVVFGLFVVSLLEKSSQEAARQNRRS